MTKKIEGAAPVSKVGYQILEKMTVDIICLFTSEHLKYAKILCIALVIKDILRAKSWNAKATPGCKAQTPNLWHLTRQGCFKQNDLLFINACHFSIPCILSLMKQIFISDRD